MRKYICQVKLSIIRQVEIECDDCEDDVDVARAAIRKAEYEYGIHDECEMLDCQRPVVFRRAETQWPGEEAVAVVREKR